MSHNELDDWNSYKMWVDEKIKRLDELEKTVIEQDKKIAIMEHDAKQMATLRGFILGIIPGVFYLIYEYIKERMKQP